MLYRNFLKPLFFDNSECEAALPIEKAGSEYVLIENSLPYPTHFDTTTNESADLSDDWLFSVPGYTAETTTVPHSFNVFDSELAGYEGRFSYKKIITLESIESDRIYRFCFDAVSINCEVYLNGARIAENHDSYQPFYADATSFIKPGENELLIRGDNIPDSFSLPLRQFEGHRAGWKVYAGITGHVRLEILPVNYCFFVRVNSSRNEVSGTAVFFGSINEADLRISDDSGTLGSLRCPGRAAGNYTEIEYCFSDLNLREWNADTPKLYTLRVETSEESVSVNFGVRMLAADGLNLRFNGKPWKARGVCVHEEDFQKGISLTTSDVERIYSLPGELGCNFVRLAHYPHSEKVMDYLDSRGMLCWSEIPNYQAGLGLIQKIFGKSVEIGRKKKSLREISSVIKTTGQLLDSRYLSRCRLQLAKMVISKLNRASVGIWGVGNECYTLTPASGKALKLLKQTVEIFDRSRLIGYAAFTIPRLTHLLDKSFRIFDLVCANEYYGWYYGNMADAEKYWRGLGRRFGKPMIITETGSDAAAGSEGNDLKTRNVNSEDYQGRMLETHLELLKTVNGLSGVCIWQLKDCFCEEYGENDIVPYCNPKGLVSAGYQRKKAFSAVQQWNRRNNVDS